MKIKCFKYVLWFESPGLCLNHSNICALCRLSIREDCTTRNETEHSDSSSQSVPVS